MSQKSVGIIITGSSNTASLEAALFRIGVTPKRIQDPEEANRTDYLLLPGVGAFGPVASKLRQTGFMDTLKERIKADRPTMAICLGMQLLFKSSSESPGSCGIAAIDKDITALTTDSSGKSRAHFGWARVGNPEQNAYAYFAHSFAAMSAPKDWQPEYADANPSFVASVRRGAVLGCQYHPEISGRYGTQVLTRWLIGEDA